jgi:beta-aspartyl-peptidase (threonine type)
MEDSPLFNAGKGAVFNSDGINELDASIMDGASLKAGAIAGVHKVKNPVLLALAVMEKSAHVMLIGDGAEKFAGENGITLVDPSYFFTDWRWQQLQKLKAKDSAATKLSEDQVLPDKSAELLRSNNNKFGTVGAVALDKFGHLAAATSTGGMTNKKWGRVGDSPIIGAGTYANVLCAVSATGHGEFFIRANVAHDICARVEYLKQSIARAGDDVVLSKLKTMGGEGGVIIIDAKGNIAMPFNTSGMYRAAIDSAGKKLIAIFHD